MHYEMQDVIRYTKEIQSTIRSPGLAGALPAKNWKEARDNAITLHNKLSTEPSKYNFEAYAQAVWAAAAFLDKKKTNSEQERFINQNIRELKKGVRYFLPEAEIDSPRPVYNPDEEHTAAATTFLNSEVFQKLKHYQQHVLTGDRRFHFFGLLAIKEKQQILGDLISKLEEQKSVEGIQAVFEAFYHQHDTTEHKSGYSILNTGQDILTYVLGLFGLKKTTSAELLDKVHEVAETLNEPEVSASQNGQWESFKDEVEEGLNDLKQGFKNLFK
ncbi:hypothetical protein [Legionella brunensis]|uniref:Uncharacterized protein n=1 Tax=Legionella brunensis TaxID=29422 RepID=A0A0W0S3M9_9GAMM|nr:hypothetical protein [Legionella brunensis]KTC78024.1 hypothetical protein Lbru_2316 [Legionella brunensis]